MDKNFLKVSSGLAGINDAMIVVEKADTLTERCSYTQYFDVVLAEHYGRKMTVRVDLIVNIPLMVKTQGLHDGKGNTETLEITLSTDHHDHLEIIRDRHWHLEDVEENMISVSAMEEDDSEKLDGTWAILDIARTSNNFYSNSTKTRIDKVVDHKELVRKIRLSAIAATHSIPNRWQAPLVGLPQIQIFAGEPIQIQCFVVQ